MTPKRPLLPAHVLARKHVAGGRSTVVVHDTRDGRVMEIGPRGWVIASCLDGTRDIDGVVAAASQAGSHDEIARFVTELDEAGLLRDGPAPPPSPLGSRGEERPVETLPGFSLRCDGQGSCCRLYPTIVFSRGEAARARAFMPDVMDAEDDESRAFLPERGLERLSLAVALVDGRCAYLLGDGRCGVHAAGGAKAKPYGCSLYPVSLVDDGTRVRVTPTVECACAVASGLAPAEGGEPLLGKAASTTAELDPRLIIDRLPARIVLGNGATAQRGDAVRWLDEAFERDTTNVALHLIELALSLEARGLAGIERPAGAWADRAAGRIESLRTRAVQRGSEAFRGPNDLARQAFALIEVGCTLALSDLEVFAAPSPATHREEAFTLEAAVFGRQLFPRSEGASLAGALFDRGVRMIVARGMRVAVQLAELKDPAMRHPLALLEATSRAYGLVV